MRMPLWLTPLVLGACATARPAAARTSTPLEYRVDLTHTASQYVHVEVRVPSRAKHTDLALPAWTPGSYRIRDFGKHVFGFDASAPNSDRPLRVELIDKQTWRVHNDGAPFTARYRVYAATPSVRTSELDDEHASLNGASVFVFEPGNLERPHHVSVIPPDGWDIYTTLPQRDGAYVAPNYDVLVDSPIEAGNPLAERFEVAETAFTYVLRRPADISLDEARLVGDAQAICRAFADLMGRLPMQRYMFLMHVGDTGGGGLEHADSTMMMVRSAAFESERGYERAAQLLAHEFFHAWNVKRIRDAALVPFDYRNESYTKLLWFHEGFTETMESLAMRRSGLWTPDQALTHLATDITGYMRKPGRNAMPLSEVSFRAWTHAYQPENNHRNETISYYEKGDLVGVALDLHLRLASDGKGSLPGVFRRLMQAVTDTGPGISAEDIVEAASAEAGTDMSDFFERYVDGVEPLPLLALLEQVGVRVKSRPVWTTDAGRDLPDAANKKAWVGLELDGVRVRNIVPGSPAAAASLMRDDEIIAIRGRRVASEAALRTALGHAGPGESVTVTLFRGSRLLERSVAIEENPNRIYTLSVPEDPGPVLRGWLEL